MILEHPRHAWQNLVNELTWVVQNSRFFVIALILGYYRRSLSFEMSGYEKNIRFWQKKFCRYKKKH